MKQEYELTLKVWVDDDKRDALIARVKGMETGAPVDSPGSALAELFWHAADDAGAEVHSMIFSDDKPRDGEDEAEDEEEADE